MGKAIVFLFCISLALCSLLGCSTSSKVSSETPEVEELTLEPYEVLKTKEPEISSDQNENTIVVFSMSSEIQIMYEKFKKVHPEFPYEFSFPHANTDMVIEGGINDPIDRGTTEAPDVYIVSDYDAERYINGEYAAYACSYEELGLDVDKLVEEAKLRPYDIAKGIGPDGKLRALPWHSSVGVFFYRRSIARDVWGTDDPAVIEQKIGGSLDNLLIAAEQLKEKGYALLSSYENLGRMTTYSEEKGWVVEGKLYIGPKREAYLDIAKTIRDKGYDNGTRSWDDNWFADMAGGREREVFGYFGNWGIGQYTIMSHSGGEEVGQGTYGDWAICKPTNAYYMSDGYILVNKNSKKKQAIGEFIRWITLETGKDGMQSLAARGELNPNSSIKEAASSIIVLETEDGNEDFYGGQNAFEVYARLSREKYDYKISAYDERLGLTWLEQVGYYVDGSKTKEQAIEDFRNIVNEYYGDKIKVD